MILYGLIFAALLLAAFVVPHLNEARDARARIDDLEQVAKQASSFRGDAIAENNRLLTDAQSSTVAELDRQIALATKERDRLIAEQEKAGGILDQYLSGGRQAVLDAQKREFQISFMDHRINSLRAFRAAAAIRPHQANVSSLIVKWERELPAQEKACKAATAKVAHFEKQWFGKKWWLEEEGRLLLDEKKARCGERDATNGNLSRARQIQSQAKANLASAKDLIERSKKDTQARLNRQADDLKKQVDDDVEWLKNTWVEKLGLKQKALNALWILVGIIFMPYLIRTFLYYVIAPLAEARPAIRLKVQNGGGAGEASVATPSAISISVPLDKADELLVRQGYYQTSSLESSSRSQWFLDWRHPFSSIASGLTFLTRVTGERSDHVTVSAVEDPFAEVALLELAEGASCVLRPRALVGAVQPVGRPVRITSEWQLFSLHAWLTFQFRFLVFHGPAKLAIKGGRGVRFEPADRGRRFGHDQLVGYSADLAYSVSRTETFLPYLFGRDALLRDKVGNGTGLLIIEEAPFAGRSGGRIARGLEGAVDAALKVVGI